MPQHPDQHGGVPEDQPEKHQDRNDEQLLEDGTTGSEGGGPAVGYGGNPHQEPPQMMPDQTHPKKRHS